MKCTKLTSIFTNDQYDAWKSLQGRTLRKNGYGNLKNGSVRRSLGVGVLWTFDMQIKKKK